MNAFLEEYLVVCFTFPIPCLSLASPWLCLFVWSFTVSPSIFGLALLMARQARGSTMWWSKANYNSVHYSAFHCYAVQLGAVQGSALHWNEIHQTSLPCSAQWCSVQYIEKHSSTVKFILFNFCLGKLLGGMYFFCWKCLIFFLFNFHYFFWH